MDTDQLQPCECEYWPATTMLMLILTSYNHVGVDTDQLQPCEGGNEPATTMRGWLTSYKHVGVWMCILASYNHVRVDTDQLQQSGVNTDQLRPCEDGVSGYWPATTMWRWWGGYWPATTIWGCLLTSDNIVGLCGWYTEQVQPCEGGYGPATTMWRVDIDQQHNQGVNTDQLRLCESGVSGYCPATTMWGWLLIS